MRKALSIISKSKILLSDNILDEAVITRPFYGISRGCLLASQFNSVLAEQFNPTDHMLDLDVHIAKTIQECLKDPNAAPKRID